METVMPIEFKISTIEKIILNRIIKKGGLFGSAAKRYLNDEKNAGLFIIECSEQCHVPTAKELWGKDLVAEILKYSGKSNKKDVLNTRLQVNKTVLLD